MSQQIAVASIAHIQQHEASILAAINDTPHGAELFVADPFRFLNEHGFVVSPALEAQLLSHARALAKAPKQLYDGIEAGRAALTSNPTYHVTLHVRSLGVQS